MAYCDFIGNGIPNLTFDFNYHFIVLDFEYKILGRMFSVFALRERNALDGVKDGG